MAEGEGTECPSLVSDQPLKADIQNSEEDDELDVGEDPEARLSRFLYLGKEYANYQPGYWFVHNYFLMQNVPSIEELASSQETQLKPIEVIEKAFKSNLVTHPEILVFALAVCCKQNKSEPLRHAAYKSIETICASPQNFILFIKFFSKLSRERELNYVTHGWGHGLRKAVTNWYLSKEPLDLAKYVTRYKSRYGWKHKDIVIMSHLKITDPERGVVIKYIMHGMKKGKEFLTEKNDDNENIKEILKHIEGVEDFKHCEDEIQAAALLERYELSLDHVPGHLLKAKEVWNSLIPSMEITTLLHNLQRINNLGILKPDALAVDKITNQLDAERIMSEKIHPALLLITLRNYEKSGKPLNYEKRKVVQTAKKNQPLPPAPNPKVIKALNKAFLSSFDHLQATNLRYLVTIDTYTSMRGLVWQGGHVTALEAACLIAMILLRCENTENVNVALLKHDEIHLANVSKEDTLDDIKLKLGKNTSPKRGILNKPILWAMEKKEKFDVFINIVDQIQENDESQKALIKYRNELELSKTKLINCAICCPSSLREKKCDKNMLIINGFDATVPLVIQAFVQSLF